MAALRTLIVDDSAVMRKIIERSLRQAGIPLERVVEAANGSQALDILGQQAIDLVLSDINMPIMDGLELVRQLHKLDNPCQAPVLMISTEGSESQVMEAIACGARGYVRKPFTPEQIRKQVLSVLGQPN